MGEKAGEVSSGQMVKGFMYLLKETELTVILLATREVFNETDAICGWISFLSIGTGVIFVFVFSGLGTYIAVAKKSLWNLPSGVEKECRYANCGSLGKTVDPELKQ